MNNYPGYVYILFNPSAQGFVKIGKTTKEPEERAAELSSATGVPTPFVVVYKAHFVDCSAAESFIHILLKDKRVTENKEFFRTTIPEAIQAVIQAENFFRDNSSSLTTGDGASPNQATESSKSSASNQELWQEIMDTADAYYYAWSDDVLQDYKEALALYKQAAKLGCAKAFHQIGDMYRDGEGVNQDIKQALYYYKGGANHGDDICWGDMAICYYEMNEYENSDKCWVKLFTSPSMKGKEDEMGYYFMNFMKYMYSVSWWPHHGAHKSFYEDLTKDKTKKELEHLIFGSR